MQHIGNKYYKIHNINKRLKILYSIIILSIVSVLYSCERDVEIDLPSDKSYLVVEGFIESGEPPRVLITRNRGFFQPNPTDLNDLINKFFVKDAIVEISDGEKTVQLYLIINLQKYPYAYYTTNQLKGENGKTYSLKVTAGGNTLKSSTQIPQPVKIDSLYFRLNIFDNQDDSLGFVFLRMTDPPVLGDGYRVYSKSNSVSDFFPIDNSEFNDQFINGLSIEFFNPKSISPLANRDSLKPVDRLYGDGDTAFIKLCAMGWKEVEFFRTLGVALNSNGNPFSSPTIVRSNIEGGLGVWYGMAASFDTLIIKK